MRITGRFRQFAIHTYAFHRIRNFRRSPVSWWRSAKAAIGQAVGVGLASDLGGLGRDEEGDRIHRFGFAIAVQTRPGGRKWPVIVIDDHQRSPWQVVETLIHELVHVRKGVAHCFVFDNGEASDATYERPSGWTLQDSEAEEEEVQRITAELFRRLKAIWQVEKRNYQPPFWFEWYHQAAYALQLEQLVEFVPLAFRMPKSQVPALLAAAEEARKIAEGPKSTKIAL